MNSLYGDDFVLESEHDLAWKSKNWEAVQKLADSYKEKPESEFFTIMNNINYGKKKLNVNTLDSYSQFAINSQLAKSEECLLACYFANLFLHQLPDQIHHDYMLVAIPQGRRYPKGTKLDESHIEKFIVRLIAKYYKVNIDKAFEYRNLLEKKGNLQDVLKKAKVLADDAFIKSITKVAREQKELKKLL